MGGQTLQMAVMVIVVFQAASAFLVMRSLRDRDDLGGIARLMPTIIAFVVPIVGGFIAGRLARAGLRPTLVSTAGLAVGLGLMAMAGPAQKPTGQPLGGKAVASADTKAGDAKTADDKKDAPKDAAKPDAQPAATPEAKPAETPKPVDAAKAAPVEARKAAPVEAPKAASAEAPKPAATPAVPAKTAEAPKPAPAAAPAPTPSKSEGAPQPAEVVTGMAAQHTLSASVSNSGGTLETQLTDGLYRGGVVYFAASITAPPGTTEAARHLYVGGGVRSHELLTVDRFGPLPLPDAQVQPGAIITVPSRRGTYTALLRVDKVTRDGAGAVQAVDFLVTFK